MATLLKNCRIYDGTGSDAVNGSVLFEGDRIIEVGDEICPAISQRSWVIARRARLFRDMKTESSRRRRRRKCSASSKITCATARRASRSV